MLSFAKDEIILGETFIWMTSKKQQGRNLLFLRSRMIPKFLYSLSGSGECIYMKEILNKQEILYKRRTEKQEGTGRRTRESL